MRIALARPDFASPQFYYTSIIATLGILLVFLVPPFQSPDEQTHLYRAYQLSEGTLIAKKLSYGAGDVLPTSLSTSFNDYYYLLFQPDKKLDTDKHAHSLAKPLNRQNVSETRFENTAPYPPLAYLPQVIAISIGKIFSANPIVLLYLARLANVAVWVFILWLCMKRQPRISLALFAFALLPIVLFQSASASADVMTAAVSIFFSIEILRLATTRGLATRRERTALLIAGSILALCKLPYVLLVLLALIIPKGKFVSVKKEWIFKIALILVPAIIALLWTLMSAKSFVNLRDIADTPAQLSFILHNPIQYAAVLYNTYVAPPSDGLYLQMIGQLGWLDTKLTFWSMLFSFAAVLLAVIGVTQVKGYSPPTPFMRIIGAVVAMLVIGAVTSVLYLTWNAPGAPIVDGLQGRYYIPLVGVMIIVFIGLLGMKQVQQKNTSIVVYCLLFLATIATIVTILFRYHSL